MCNIVLNDDLSIRSYFEKVLELVESGEDFPVNLDDVWPLIYSDKGKAVRVLTGDNGFIKNIDYKVFTQNGKNPVGGRPTISLNPFGYIEHLFVCFFMPFGHFV
jgi:hypothetical protein